MFNTKSLLFRIFLVVDAIIILALLIYAITIILGP
jgi:hypothetical protein